jgi:molybdopterin molybdotransferase
MSAESINPDPNCADDFDPNSMPVDVALARIKAALTPLTHIESVAVRDALGRVLAMDVKAPFDVPPHRNSGRDGYAINDADLGAGDGIAALTVVGTSWAGKPFTGTVASGSTVRIMTGASMPEGTDSVVMQEHVERREGIIRFERTAPTAGNVRYPGEDFAAGVTVLRTGKLLRPADLGVLASMGLAEVRVFRKLRVAFFSTGDELRTVGEPLAPGDIYDSNRYTLHGMLRRLGVEMLDLGVIPDSRDAVRKAFHDAAQNADVVVSTGGVSVGDADYVTELLAELGTVDFWKIAMKPGRPLTFGRIKQAHFFGLPGNPVSVMVTFYQFVQPALRCLRGETAIAPTRVRVPLANPIKKQPGRLEFQRGILEVNAAGTLQVGSTGAQGSHVLNSMSQANCFIVLALECAGVAAGELVEVEPFDALV